MTAMPDRNAHIHGDENTYDPEPYRQRALDEVIETIMLFGQWPQPRTGSGWHTPTPRRVEFDLVDWISENLEPQDTAQFLMWSITNDDGAYTLQTNLEKRIEERLRVELADSSMVDDVIESLHEDERAEHDGR